jgi:hypothetical protein
VTQLTMRLGDAVAGIEVVAGVHDGLAGVTELGYCSMLAPSVAVASPHKLRHKWLARVARRANRSRRRRADLCLGGRGMSPNDVSRLRSQ